MSGCKEESLSPDEMRQKLYQTFKSRGLLDALKIEEKEIYAQRQALLKEIESVRSRETEIKQRIEAFDKTCKLHEEKVKTMDDLLRRRRRRERSVKTIEDRFDQKLKSELVKYQLELKEDYIKRMEKLTENEKKRLFCRRNLLLLMQKQKSMREVYQK